MQYAVLRSPPVQQALHQAAHPGCGGIPEQYPGQPQDMLADHPDGYLAQHAGLDFATTEGGGMGAATGPAAWPAGGWPAGLAPAEAAWPWAGFHDGAF